MCSSQETYLDLLFSPVRFSAAAILKALQVRTQHHHGFWCWCNDCTDDDVCLLQIYRHGSERLSDVSWENLKKEVTVSVEMEVRPGPDPSLSLEEPHADVCSWLCFFFLISAAEQCHRIWVLTGGVPPATGGVLVQVLLGVSSVPRVSVHAAGSKHQQPYRPRLSAQEGQHFCLLNKLWGVILTVVRATVIARESIHFNLLSSFKNNPSIFTNNKPFGVPYKQDKVLCHVFYFENSLCPKNKSISRGFIDV